MKKTWNRIREKIDFYQLFLLAIYPELVFADFPSSVTSLVSGALTGIFPAVLMYEAGKAGVAFAKKAPDAKEKVEHVAIGTVAVLGINGVWSYVKSHVK